MFPTQCRWNSEWLIYLRTWWSLLSHTFFFFFSNKTMSSDRNAWKIKSSKTAQQAHNPIRAIVDQLKVDPKATKPLISLSIGKRTRKRIMLTCLFQEIPLFSVISMLIPASMKQLLSRSTVTVPTVTHLPMVYIYIYIICIRLTFLLGDKQ